LLSGLIFIGFIQALVFIPCLPEAIETFQCKYRIVEGFDIEFDNKLSDCTASMYSQLYNLAALIGPVIGGGLYQMITYEPTMNSNVLLQLILACLFAYYNCGRDCYKNAADLKEMISKLKEIGEIRKKKLEELKESKKPGLAVHRCSQDE
jgi:hypothetical protein